MLELDRDQWEVLIWQVAALVTSYEAVLKLPDLDQGIREEVERRLGDQRDHA